MKIRKSEDKTKKEESGLATREEWPWLMDPFRNFEEYADRFFSDIWRDFPELRGRFLHPQWMPSLMHPRLAPRWAETGGALALKTPAMDLKDNGKEFVIRAEMPGVSKDDVDITINNDSVEIKAESHSGREEEREGYYYREIGRNSYYRRIPLPEEVEAEKAEGRLEDGVLHLTLPKTKPTEVKSHKVKLQ